MPPVEQSVLQLLFSSTLTLVTSFFSFFQKFRVSVKDSVSDRVSVRVAV